MKYLFIVNKIAGKGKSEKIVPNIEKVCKDKNIDFEVKYISKEKSGYDIAMEYKEQECVIYIVGGDGTLTITLPALIGTKNKIGIIPTGSGNDTYRAIRKLKQGESKIDVGKINDRYFINVASMGIDAEIGNNMDKFRNKIIPASQRYNVSILYTFCGFKYKNMKMSTNIKNIIDKYTILSICNGSHYGGGFNISPRSSLVDGLFDIYYVEPMHKFKIIPLIFKMKKGKHVGKRRIHKFRTNHIELELEEEVAFNVDGEKLVGTKLVADVIPKALRIYNDDKFVEDIMGDY